MSLAVLPARFRAALSAEEGEVRFSPGLQRDWQYPSHADQPWGAISDCYALNVTDTHVWACYYTDWPVVRIRDGAESRSPGSTGLSCPADGRFPPGRTSSGEDRACTSSPPTAGTSLISPVSRVQPVPVRQAENEVCGCLSFCYHCGMSVTAADVRTVDQLLGFIHDGGQPEYLMFWGHQPPPAGDPGKACLSQWWPVPFTVEGATYASAEHFMMAAKATLFGDAETAERIRAAPDPGAAKALGRQVRGFDEQRWAEWRFGLVVAGNLAKFGQHRELRDFLLGTGSRVLVEASPLDRIWGSGLAADDERAASPRDWPGLNLLGFALMEVRRQLQLTTAQTPQ
jgi:ribA/ribD-fused uncharacterized protein